MRRLLLFLIAGLPAFLIAVPLNYALVEVVEVPAPAAYAAVLVVQVSCNFFMLRAFVFDAALNRTPTAVQFLRFLSGIGTFRLIDWATFTVMVEVVGIYFLVAQIANITLFSLLKFKFSQHVIEGRPASRPGTLTTRPDRPHRDAC